MDNFKIIYRILKTLEAAMDCEEFDAEQISAKALGISEQRWLRLVAMLAEEGYTKGLNARHGLDGTWVVSRSRPEITLKGLEYLNENGLMKKAMEAAKGIKESVPFL